MSQVSASTVKTVTFSGIVYSLTFIGSDRYSLVRPVLAVAFRESTYPNMVFRSVARTSSIMIARASLRTELGMAAKMSREGLS